MPGYLPSTDARPVAEFPHEDSLPRQQTQPSVLLITVNYRAEGETVALVNSLSKWKCFAGLSVIIIDNASDNDSIQIIRDAISRFHQVTLIESSTNLGYFRAAGKALKHHLEGQECPDWVIVCNNDVIVEDEDFVQKLSRHDPLKVGVVAPRILAIPAHVDQNPFMQGRPGRWTRLTLRICSSSYWMAVARDWLSDRTRSLKSWLTPFAKSPGQQTVTTCPQIYAAHGSFLIFSRRFFEAGGYFDENLFLYGEEISVGEICYSLKLPVLYDTSLCVEHREHVSTGKQMTRSVFENHKKATQYVLSKYLCG
jgi:GT2 family glycosyltransferase